MSASHEQDGHASTGRKRRHQQDPVVANPMPMGYASAYADPYRRWAGYGYYPHMPFQPHLPGMVPAPGMAPGFIPPPPPPEAQEMESHFPRSSRQ